MVDASCMGDTRKCGATDGSSGNEVKGNWSAATNEAGVWVETHLYHWSTV